MTSEYELPPLPDPVTYAHFTDDGMIRMWSKERTNLQAVTGAIGKQPSALISLEQAEAYAIAAIEADRKRRGEPIANLWVNSETLEFEVDSCNHPIDELIPVYEAPQPAEPCDHSYHYFGDYPIRRCNKCKKLEQQPAEPVKVPSDPAVAAIQFALQTDEALPFLQCWNEGNFDAIRREWPEAPEEVFIGADPMHPETRALLARYGSTADEVTKQQKGI